MPEKGKQARKEEMPWRSLLIVGDGAAGADGADVSRIAGI
jgi:hypothetical protein